MKEDELQFVIKAVITRALGQAYLPVPEGGVDRITASIMKDAEWQAKARTVWGHPGAAKIEAVLVAANEVIGHAEGPENAPQARLAIALHDYDPARFGLGLKEICECSAEEKAECDECLTNAQALAACRRMAASDQPQT